MCQHDICGVWLEILYWSNCHIHLYTSCACGLLNFLIAPCINLFTFLHAFVCLFIYLFSFPNGVYFGLSLCVWVIFKICTKWNEYVSYIHLILYTLHKRPKIVSLDLHCGLLLSIGWPGGSNVFLSFFAVAVVAFVCFCYNVSFTSSSSSLSSYIMWIAYNTIFEQTK